MNCGDYDFENYMININNHQQLYYLRTPSPSLAPQPTVQKTFGSDPWDSHSYDLNSASSVNPQAPATVTMNTQHVPKASPKYQLSNEQKAEPEDNKPEMKLKKFLTDRKIKFQEYLCTLSTEEQEFAKSVLAQFSQITNGEIILPDNQLLQEMVPLPECIGSIPSTSFTFDSEASLLENIFSEFEPVDNLSLVLPPWPEKSSLTESVTSKREQDEILSSLGIDGTLGHRLFGQLVTDEMQKIDAQRREAVAKRILGILKDSELGEPGRKRARLDESLHTDSAD